jgi:RND superfamily putative drug exporter
VIWFGVLVGVGVAATGFGGTFNDSFALPGAQSTQAQRLLQELAPKGPATTSVTIVWKAPDVRGEKSRAEAERLLKRVAALPGVRCVQTPFRENYGPRCADDTNVPVTRLVARGIATELQKEVGLSAKQIDAAARALAPVADADAQTLGRLAASLPAVAQVAALPPDVLTGLVDIGDLVAQSDGQLTTAEATQLSDALGGLEKLSSLPPATLRALAAADPGRLAEAARRLPAEAAEVRKLDAELQDAIRELHRAAKATQRATAQVSREGRIAYATVTFDGASLPAATADEILTIVRGVDGLEVGVQGAALEGAGAGGDYSELIGIGVAVVILLIAFGSLVAAGLPIIVAGAGLVAGQLLIVLAARLTDVASFAPTLAAMIGLGVGIDYALFVFNRFYQGLQQGLEPKEAVLRSVGTAGKAVLFAGSTVILALLGMFVLGIRFFDGLAVAAAAAVLMVMASALWFLPALLSLLGHRALALRLPGRRKLPPFDPAGSRWAGYGAFLQRKPFIPLLLSLALLAALAWPALGMRLGFPDDGTQAVGSPLRTGFDLMSEGFGAGIGAPFVVAVEVPKKDDYTALGHAITALERTPGVARTLPDSRMLPLIELEKSVFGDRGRLTSVVVYPAADPESARDAELLAAVRDTTAPALEREHRVRILVGGAQAVATDFTTVLGRALPLFLLLVVSMGFLALVLLFRSILIPLTAAVTSLLSFAAALGVTVAVFERGVGAGVLGLGGTGPILPFLPVMVFAILFGLSMDYQVFLVSRMREQWESSGDNKDAVRMGLAGSGRVVVIAASIMTSVFLAFVPTPIDTIKLFGVALAAAVIIDAFLVRLVLVPSLMTILGRANWWLPRWLDRVLPRITLE